MNIRLSRPNPKKPDQYTMELDEVMVMWLEDALSKQIHSLRIDIRAHEYCTETVCKVNERTARKEDLKKYGPSTCDEDMMFLYSEIATLFNARFQMIYLRNHPEDTNGDFNIPPEAIANDTPKPIDVQRLLQAQEQGFKDAQQRRLVNDTPTNVPLADWEKEVLRQAHVDYPNIPEEEIRGQLRENLTAAEVIANDTPRATPEEQVHWVKELLKEQEINEESDEED